MWRPCDSCSNESQPAFAYRSHRFCSLACFTKYRDEKVTHFNSMYELASKSRRFYTLIIDRISFRYGPLDDDDPAHARFNRKINAEIMDYKLLAEKVDLRMDEYKRASEMWKEAECGEIQ